MKVGDELWAWLTDVPNYGTSIVGVAIPGLGGHTPLVFASKRAAEKAHELAVAHGAKMGQPVRLVHFKAVSE